MPKLAKRKPKPPVQVSDREIVNAVEACEGDYHRAAKKLCIAYSTILKRSRSCPEIYEAKLNCLGDMIQIAEINVYEKLMQGDFAASKFVLERLAREKWGSQPAQGPADNWPEPIGDRHGP